MNRKEFVELVESVKDEIDKLGAAIERANECISRIENIDLYVLEKRVEEIEYKLQEL
jgi:prefoldin subunit 5